MKDKNHKHKKTHKNNPNKKNKHKTNRSKNSADLAGKNINRQLHIACVVGSEKRIKLLLKKGADPNYKHNDENTPLHLACNNGHFKIVEALINHPEIKVNIKNKEKNTPLHLACNNGHFKIVEILKKEYEKKLKNPKTEEKEEIKEEEKTNNLIANNPYLKNSPYKKSIGKKKTKLLKPKNPIHKKPRAKKETPQKLSKSTTKKESSKKPSLVEIRKALKISLFVLKKQTKPQIEFLESSVIPFMKQGAKEINGYSPHNQKIIEENLKLLKTYGDNPLKKLLKIEKETEDKLFAINEEIKKEKEKTNNLIASNPYLKNSPYKKSIAKKNKKPLKPKKTITVSLQLFDKEDPSLYEKMLKKKTNDQGFEFNPNYNLIVDSKTPLRKTKSMLSEQIKGSIDSIYFQLFLPGKNNKWIRVKKGDNNKLYSPLSSLMDKNENNKVIKIKYKIAYWIQFYAHTFLKKKLN